MSLTLILTSTLCPHLRRNRLKLDCAHGSRHLKANQPAPSHFFSSNPPHQRYPTQDWSRSLMMDHAKPISPLTLPNPNSNPSSPWPYLQPPGPQLLSPTQTFSNANFSQNSIDPQPSLTPTTTYPKPFKGQEYGNLRADGPCAPYLGFFFFY